MENEDMVVETASTAAAAPILEGNNSNNEEQVVDEEPAFIDMNDAVEVKVDDDDVPMDDEDVDESDVQNFTRNIENVPDQSKFRWQAHSDSVYSVAAHLQGQQLTVLSGGGDDRAYWHKSGDGTSTVCSFAHSDTVSSVALNLEYVLNDSPRLAAVGGYDGTIVIYDFDTGAQKWNLEGPSDVEWLAFHPKGGTVLLAGSGDGTVWMYHLPLNKCLQVFVGHEQAVVAGAFSPDGKWALSASADGSLRVWAPKTGLNKHVFALGAPLTSFAIHGGSDGKLVMVGAEDGQAHVCHVGTKKVVASLRHFETPSVPNSNGASEDEEMEFPSSVEAVGFCPAFPNWCATGGVDGKLKIWDLDRNGQCRQVCAVATEGGEEADAPPDSITRLKWHPTLPIIFTSTVGGNVRVWDARNGALLQTLTGSTSTINDLNTQFVQDTGVAVIVTASDDKAVRAFELDINALLQQQGAANGP